MAEFLLNIIPHHPKILRSSNNLNLRLPRHLQCKTCTTFLDDLVYNPKQKRRTSANKICERPWQERNSTSRMKVKRISYQGVQSFLLLEGIHHDTCDGDEANYTTGAMGTNEENHDDDHDDMVNTANGKDEPPGDIPETSSTTIPATIILPAPLPPTTATASATTSLDATSASSSSDTSSQSGEPSASSDPNPTLQEQEGYKRPRKPYTKRFDPQTTADGKYTVQDVPNHYSLIIYGSTLAELQQDAKSFHELKNALLGQAKCN
jgi:hypothetical protein